MVKKVPFGSDLHERLLTALKNRIELGLTNVRDKEDQWRRNEEQFLAYLPERENDRLRRGERESGKPAYTTIEIPYSYAMVLAQHTYLCSVLLARSPIEQVIGLHGESQMSELAVESVLNYQTTVGNQIVPYHIWTLDPLKYGCGIVGVYWDKEIHRVRKFKQVEKPSGIFGLGPMRTVTEEFVEEVRGYEGTRLFNIRPQDFLFDPRFPISRFQEGEFCGHYCEMAMLDLKDLEEQGEVFNIGHIQRHNTGNTLRVQGSSQIKLPNDNGLNFLMQEDSATGFVEGYELCVRLIPSQWGLGSGKSSEKWLFTVVNNRVIIDCRPLGYYHNQFPYSVLEGEVDGHSAFARSPLEVSKPLNDTLSWLVNTHFYNTRKALNDMFVYDPSRVVAKDLDDPLPGKRIRLRPSAYGSDIRTLIQQFPVVDVTRAHMNDAGMITEMLHKVLGVNDTIMGSVNTGRRTAQEVRSSTTFGVNRLKTLAEYYSAMGFAPLTRMKIAMSQQMMDGERAYRIMGDMPEDEMVKGFLESDKFLRVSPDMIAGMFDFVPVDGTLPVDRMAMVNLWQALMGQAYQVPQVAQGFDFTKIFSYVAKLGGIRNIDHFRVKVIPDEQALQARDAGNNVPITGGRTTTSGMPEPGQLNGMGPTL